MSGIVPRRVRFDFDHVDRHWLAGRPGLTHQANGLHVLFPPGEKWFVRIANKALPRLKDRPELAAATRGFLGQEGLHARSHEGFFDTLRSQGFPVDKIATVLEREIQRRERLLPYEMQPP